MRRLLFILLTPFALGLMIGAAGDQTEPHTVYKEVIASDPEWYFPAQCHDTIVFGVSTQFTTNDRVEQYNNLAAECFDVVERDIGQYENTFTLPAPTTSIVEAEENSLDAMPDDVVQVEIDNAFEDCLDEEWSEYYCEDNFEEWVDYERMQDTYEEMYG